MHIIQIQQPPDQTNDKKNQAGKTRHSHVWGPEAPGTHPPLAGAGAGEGAGEGARSY